MVVWLWAAFIGATVTAVLVAVISINAINILTRRIEQLELEARMDRLPQPHQCRHAKTVGAAVTYIHSA